MKYLRNTENVVIRGDFTREEVQITTESGVGVDKLAVSKRTSVRVVVKGVVVIDPSILYGLDEKILCDKPHNWTEVDTDEIEDLL